MSNLCSDTPVDFIFKEDSPEIKEIGDPFRKDLKAVNITVREIPVSKTEFADREKNGDYNIVFTKTWGSPYDPHSYLSAWAEPAHVEFTSTKGLKKPMTHADVQKRIATALREQNENARATQYKEMFDGIHKQAAFLPLYGVKTPYVISNRLSGFKPSPQTYSYPLAPVVVKEGIGKVSVAPGSGGTLFTEAGRIHPHLYAPNEMWAQDWVYERLVQYGDNGAIEPMLAESWTQGNEGKGWKFVFKLREGVTFHNGEPWNCAAAKLNFDHVLHPDVKSRHSWFKGTEVINKWGCEGPGKNDFFITTNAKYYPLLAELTYIRPLSFAAPGAFADGVNTDPKTANSCHPNEFGDKHAAIEKVIKCRGLSKSIGTGPFQLVSRLPAVIDGTKVDSKVIFKKYANYWRETGNITDVEVRYYKTTDEVKEALLKGDLDMALGIGPLEAPQIKDLRENHKDKVSVTSSGVTQHAIAVLNTDKAPTNDINVRKAIVYGVDKAKDFATEEFADTRVVADQLMPRTQPYSNLELEPKFRYSLDTARESCGLKAVAGGSGSGVSTGGVVGIVIAVLAVLGIILGVLFMRKRKAGQQGVEPLRAGAEEEGQIFS